MSTGKCDKEVYEHGKAVAIIADRDGDAIEKLVKSISSMYDVKMDWHYIAGRGVVLALGDEGIRNIVRNDFRRYANGYLKVVEENGSWDNGTKQKQSDDTENQKIMNVEKMEPMETDFGQKIPMELSTHFVKTPITWGTYIGKNVCVMYSNHSTEECEYLIVVNTRTGERLKIHF